jgi:hypothetical protein
MFGMKSEPEQKPVTITHGEFGITVAPPAGGTMSEEQYRQKDLGDTISTKDLTQVLFNGDQALLLMAVENGLPVLAKGLATGRPATHSREKVRDWAQRVGPAFAAIAKNLNRLL